jgi:hypothetical protein
VPGTAALRSYNPDGPQAAARCAKGVVLRNFRGQTDRRLFAGFVVILLIVGGGLIYALYGPGAAILGLLCLGGGLAPVALLWLILKALEWWGKRTGQW